MARENKDFIALMNQLDIVRDHKAVFLGRYETPMFLAENTDIVVSHQLENPLNYLYLEVCWQGYALVHNAHPHHIDSDIVYRGVEHFDDLITGRRSQLVGRHCRRTNAQQLILLGTQHHAGLKAIQLHCLQLANQGVQT